MNAYIVLNCVESAYSIFESALYRSVSSDGLSHFKKIQVFVYRHFKKMQQFSGWADVALRFTKSAFVFVIKQPCPLLLSTVSLVNFALFSVKTALKLVIQSHKLNVAMGLLERVASVALNAFICFQLFHLSSPLLLGSFALTVATSCYSLYKNRQIRWLHIPVTVQDSRSFQDIASELQRSILNLIPYGSVFPEGEPLPPPLQHLQRDVFSIDRFSFDSSMSKKVSNDKAAYEKESKKYRGTSVSSHVDTMLYSLRESVQKGYPTMQLRMDHLSELFRQQIPHRAEFAIQQMRFLILAETCLRVEKVAFDVELLVPSSKEIESCAVCLGQNGEGVKFCPNGHFIHEACVKELVSHNLTPFQPSQSIYSLRHKDIWGGELYASSMFLRTERSYLVTTHDRGNFGKCPLCREEVGVDVSISSVHDRTYGEIADVALQFVARQ